MVLDAKQELFKSQGTKSYAPEAVVDLAQIPRIQICHLFPSVHRPHAACPACVSFLREEYGLLYIYHHLLSLV